MANETRTQAHRTLAPRPAPSPTASPARGAGTKTPVVGSPMAAPAQVGELVEAAAGSSGSITGMVRQLQRGFGNLYVEKALQPQGERQDNAQPGSGATPITPPSVPGTVIELKGSRQLQPSEEVDRTLEAAGRKGAPVTVQFGRLARGSLTVSRHAGRRRDQPGTYWAASQGLELNHPFFDPLRALGLEPRLFVRVENNLISGSIGLAGKGSLYQTLHGTPDALGLVGFDFLKAPEVVNKLQDGQLSFGIQNATLGVSRFFSGKASLLLMDENVQFNGALKIQHVKGIGEGDLNLNRSPEGVFTGDLEVDVTLSKHFSGKMKAAWDGQALTGVAAAHYEGEKLQGTVMIYLMTADQAEVMKAQKKAAAEAAPDAVQTPTLEQAPARKHKGKPDYVVAGDGQLAFTFNEWLTGTAQVIVDSQGHVTVIGEITPHAQLDLFSPDPHILKFPPLEASAFYGLPYVADIVISASLEFSLWAILGPGVFKDIKVKGRYSTDPKERQEFTLMGTLNISAQAGASLSATGEAGLRILGHKISIGAGITGTIGIKAYVEARPIVGYREEGAQDQDKKGIFFLSGEIEAAAQAFLGLEGDLFVHLDSPWWSPAPNKTWCWVLGEKEWPLGSGLGVDADVEYIFGSGKAPAFTMKEAAFDGSKFIDQIVHDDTPDKQKRSNELPTPWKEKNTAANERQVPEKSPKRALPSGTPEAPRVKSVQPPPPRPKEQKAQEAPPLKEHTPQGVEHHLERQEAEKEKALRKIPPKMREAADADLQKPPVEPSSRWERGVTVVRQALEYAEKNGIELDELNSILRSIRKRREYGFTDLHAEDGGEVWVVLGSMSASRKVTSVKKKQPPASGVQPWAKAPKAQPGVAATPTGTPTQAASPEPKRPEDEGEEALRITLLLPSVKQKHLGLYRSLAREKRLVHRAGYDREVEGQARVWDRGVMPGGGDYAMNQRTYELGVKLGLGPDRPNPGGWNRILRPDWSTNEPHLLMQVDHVVELQVLRPAEWQWADSFSNYELLDRSSNASSGSTLKNNIDNERADLVRRTGNRSWLRRNLIFNHVEVAPGEPGQRWEKDDIQQGKHLRAYLRHIGETPETRED